MTESEAQILPYEKEAPNDSRWTFAAYDALISGAMAASLISRSGIRTVRVAGPCPRCRHEVNVSQVLDAVSGERSSPRADEESAEVDYITVTAACQCGERHQGRPDDKNLGCGINFLVEIAAE